MTYDKLYDHSWPKTSCMTHVKLYDHSWLKTSCMTHVKLYDHSCPKTSCMTYVKLYDHSWPKKSCMTHVKLYDQSCPKTSCMTHVMLFDHSWPKTRDPASDDSSDLPRRVQGMKANMIRPHLRSAAAPRATNIVLQASRQSKHVVRVAEKETITEAAPSFSTPLDFSELSDIMK
eukprot:gene27238-2492_t